LCSRQFPRDFWTTCDEDQQAIKEIEGKPVLLNEYDEAGRAELEFNDREGQPYFIFAAADLIKAAY
jgi:hypothetical protein